MIAINLFPSFRTTPPRMAILPLSRCFHRICLVLGILAVLGANAANEKLPIHVPTDGAKWLVAPARSRSLPVRADPGTQVWNRRRMVDDNVTTGQPSADRVSPRWDELCHHNYRGLDLLQ